MLSEFIYLLSMKQEKQIALILIKELLVIFSPFNHRCQIKLLDFS